MSLSHPTNPTSDRSQKHLSDEAIASYVHTKHRDDDHKIKIDVENYVALVDSIIKTADRISLTVSQGTKRHLIFSDDFFNVNVVDPPVCTLHQISSKVIKNFF